MINIDIKNNENKVVGSLNINNIEDINNLIKVLQSRVEFLKALEILEKSRLSSN